MKTDYVQRILSQAIDKGTTEYGRGRESANYDLAGRILENLAYNNYAVVSLPDPVVTVCEICDKETNGGARHASCERDGWYEDETREQYV